ncbi:MAG: hypothetical protein GXP62_17645, partial [Oligoflexia bacterium]|nr:hypothetical protein [Oligoflexia bacterium]
MHIELQRAKPSPRLPLGQAACGAASVDLDPPLGVPMAGYSTDGHRAAGTGRALRARAIWVEDATGEVVVFVVADLMSATRYLWEATAVALATRVGITRERLILSGTHTHTGPGGLYGQSLYDTLASCWPGFDPLLVAHLVDRLARAVQDA